MIKIWDCYPNDKIRITDVDGGITDGIVECVTDVEEQSDLCGQEDSIGIITDEGIHLEFYESYIKSIEKIQLAVINEPIAV